ncbi:hypothetical protein [Streptomyces sp. NPDC058664]|uniref:hypothetical protein n=1 Tax=unclassified Streptomyces TaxID=2593676 RepID=UPI003660794F
MRISKISASVISGMLLAGGMLAASITPASAGTGAPGKKENIPADFAAWWEWRCPIGTSMLNFSLTTGPNVQTFRRQDFPQDNYNGPGVGMDVINMSHTEGSWFEANYSCSQVSPTPVTINKDIGVVSIGREEDMLLQWVNCPDSHPHFISSQINDKNLPAGGEMTVTPNKVGGLATGVLIVLTNPGRLTGQVTGNITCERLATS